MRRLCLFVASGLGLGLVAPFAPGTFGSLPGVALAYATTALALPVQIAVCAALALLAVPICGVAERSFGIKDDGRITADEWMLYPVALVGIPLASLPWWSMGESNSLENSSLFDQTYIPRPVRLSSLKFPM